MEDNYYASDDEQKMFINYFDALYLLNIVFKENKYEFIDTSHVSQSGIRLNSNIISSVLLKHLNITGWL